MNINKFLVLLLSSLFLVACGGSSDGSGETSGPVTEETVEAPTEETTEPPTEEETSIDTGLFDKAFEHDNVSREYLLYIPSNFTGNEQLPLLFAFHGLGGDRQRSYDATQFNLLAEENNFILVHPQGLTLPNGLNAWNLANLGTDDVGFVTALLDDLVANYNIDTQRVYSTGISNGGFFSYKLACEENARFAAIAPVAGTMTDSTLANCAPIKPTPVLHVHGTSDNVVSYDNAAPALDYWIAYNRTSTTAVLTMVPDIDSSDGSTVERYVYADGDNGVRVEHLKVINGKHEWPGSQGNMDIDTSIEAWEFMSQYDTGGLISQ